MPMRVELWPSQLGIDALLKAFGDEVFKSLSLLVHFLQWVVENLIEKRFYQPMVTKDLKRAELSPKRQANSAMLFVFDVRHWNASELLQHVCYRCGRDSQARRKSRARYTSFFTSAEGKDRLEVVIDRFRVGIHLALGRHSYDRCSLTLLAY